MCVKSSHARPPHPERRCQPSFSLQLLFLPPSRFAETGFRPFGCLIHAGDAVASLRKSADDIIDVVNGIN